jgi:Predicted membrane protein
MNENICQQIEDSAHFRELVEKRQRFATILSLIMLVIYVGFILLIAFAPGWLGTPLHAGTNVTRGIPIGIGIIIISFVLTAIYVWRANGEFDRLNKAVLHEVKVS